jgi:O-acetylserine/cysteine efflux transporter
MLFTLFFASIFLGEKWKIPQVLALILAGAGLSILASQTDASQMTFIGFALTIAAASAWGLGNIINRKIGQLGNVNLMSLVIWAALIPPIPFLGLSYLMEGPELILSSLMHIDATSIAALLYLALIATIFGYGSWAYLMKHYPASQVAPLTLLVPIVGLITAWLLLDEGLNTIQIVGICLMMLGLAINVFGHSLMIRLKQKSLRS